MRIISRKQYVDSEKKVEKKIEGETQFIGWIYKLPDVGINSV